MTADSRNEYRVQIAPSRTNPGVLEYTITRRVRTADVLPPRLAEIACSEMVDEPFADLTTPRCSRTVARRIALEWIGAHDPGAFDLKVDWRDEPIAPVRESSGVGGRYAEHGRRRWFARSRPV